LLRFARNDEVKNTGIACRSRHARDGGHLVIAGVSDRAEKPRRTGSSAFADDDSVVDDDNVVDGDDAEK
jgi:hypothetical protein